MTSSITHSLLLFTSTFALVFCLGLQSLLVNRGHHTGAFINSFLIGIGQLVLLKLGPEASGIEIAGYLCGGPFAIVSAMKTHRFFDKQVRRRHDPRSTQSQPTQG